MKRKEINLFSTSFLDLLSGAFGAITLLAIIFSSIEKADSKVDAKPIIINFEVLSSAMSGSPKIGIYLDIESTIVKPSSYSKPRSIHLIKPDEDLSQKYTIVLAGEDFTSKDFIYLYLADFIDISKSDEISK